MKDEAGPTEHELEPPESASNSNSNSNSAVRPAHSWQPSDRLLALLLLLAAVAIREVWCFTLPLDAASDEVIHVYTAHVNRHAGRLAILGVDPGAHAYIHPGYPIHSLPYFTHPPATYALGALMLALSGSGGEAYLWLRQVNVFLAALAAPLAFLTLRLAFPRPSPVPAAVAILMAFGPQFVFHGSYFCAEGFGLFSTGVLYLTATLLWRDGFTGKTILTAAVGLALLTWSSLTYWPAAMVLLVPAVRRWRAAPGRIRLLAVASLLLPLLALGSWMGRNAHVYGSWNAGSVVGREMAHPVGRLPGFRVTAPHPHMVCGEPYLYQIGLGYLARSTFMSFWGVYGYMALLMPPAYYFLWLAVCLAAAAGLALAVRRIGPEALGTRPAVSLLAGYLVPFYAALLAYVYFNVGSSSLNFQPQARYLFSGLLPLLLLLALGLRELLARAGRPQLLPALCAVLTLAANAWSLLAVARAPWPHVTWLS